MAFQQLARICKASGDELRLQILRVLSVESLGALELAAVFEMRQPAISHHLKVLLKANLVTTRKEHNSLFYRRALWPTEKEVDDAVQGIFKVVDTLVLPDTLLQRLHSIHQNRIIAARAFLERSTEQGLFSQALEVMDNRFYAEALVTLMRTTQFPALELALEIGSGRGEF